jgi:hypothetical protein
MSRPRPGGGECSAGCGATHSSKLVEQDALVSGLENLERSTTYDRNKRANTSGYRDFLNAFGVATA